MLIIMLGRPPLRFFGIFLWCLVAGCGKAESDSAKWEREHNYSDPGDDPRMKAAEAEAMKRWPEFAAAFKRRQPNQGFAVKAKFTEGKTTEWMWVEVDSMTADAITGRVDNDPVDVHNVKLGDTVTRKRSEIDDWIYKDSAGMHGGFTSKVLQQIDDERKAKK
jgi:uncharacterized protein YegJ (DUF2314 family)